jgi:hypothetical protein
MDEKFGSNVVDVGVDLSEFYMSVEWDILEVIYLLLFLISLLMISLANAH